MPPIIHSCHNSLQHCWRSQRDRSQHHSSMSHVMLLDLKPFHLHLMSPSLPFVIEQLINKLAGIPASGIQSHFQNLDMDILTPPFSWTSTTVSPKWWFICEIYGYDESSLGWKRRNTKKWVLDILVEDDLNIRFRPWVVQMVLMY